jgi:DNA-binding winged helix-turn-helix (wHTH) protein/tetratricopeptide (TPR) repeat protein
VRVPRAGNAHLAVRNIVASSATSFRLNHWQVDPALDSIANGPSCIKLDPRPMQVLVVLAQRAGQVLSQRQIEQAVWGDVMVTTNSVYQCITQLRKALGDDAKQPQYIQTIPRKGYRLIARVCWEATESGADTRTHTQSTQPNTVATVESAPVLPSKARARWRRIAVGVALLLLAAIIIEGKRIADERALARRERARAQQVSQIMLEVFSAADPFVNLGRPITARELLENRAQHLSADLDRQPLLRAQVLETIGRSYRRQGLHEQAVPALEEALQIRRSDSAKRPETGSLLAELGVAFHNLGRFADSERAFTAALEIRSLTVKHRSKLYARLLADIGTLELARSHPHRAVTLLDEGLELLRARQDADQQQVASILEDLGQARLWLEDTASAERAARAAFDIHERTLPALHPDRVMTGYGLGEVLRLLGRHSEAEPLLLAALTAQRRLYGGKGAQIARTLNSLALLKFAQGQQQQAAGLALEAAAAVPAGGADAIAGDARLELIRQLLSHDDFAAAERQARSVSQALQKQPPQAQYAATAEYFLGEALLGQQRLSEAEHVLRSAAQRWEHIDALGWRSALCTSALGEVLHLAGRSQDAEPLLLAGYRAIAVDLGADQQVKRKVYQRLARFYNATGRREALLQLEIGDRQARTSPPITQE